MDVRNIENDRGELDFVRRSGAGTVHIIVQRGPYWNPNPEFDDRWSRTIRRHAELFGITMTPGEVIAFSPKLTMCGQVVNTSPAFDNELTDCFADDELCGLCHRTLGEHAARAFEHHQPGDPA